jgi:predicted transcriptional regulator YdeE
MRGIRVTTTTDVSIKQVPPTVFLASVHEDVTIPEIATIARNEMEQMIEALQAAGGVPSSQITFIYHGADGTPTTPFRLTLAVPLATVPAHVPGPYELLESPEFTCVATDFVGPMPDIMWGYDRIFSAMREQNLQRTAESREIYKKWIGFESPDNVTELQVGVQ